MLRLNRFAQFAHFKFNTAKTSATYQIHGFKKKLEWASYGSVFE